MMRNRRGVVKYLGIVLMLFSVGVGFAMVFQFTSGSAEVRAEFKEDALTTMNDLDALQPFYQDRMEYVIELAVKEQQADLSNFCPILIDTEQLTQDLYVKEDEQTGTDSGMYKEYTLPQLEDGTDQAAVTTEKSYDALVVSGSALAALSTGTGGGVQFETPSRYTHTLARTAMPQQNYVLENLRLRDVGTDELLPEGAFVRAGQLIQVEGEFVNNGCWEPRSDITLLLNIQSAANPTGTAYPFVILEADIQAGQRAAFQFESALVTQSMANDGIHFTVTGEEEGTAISGLSETLTVFVAEENGWYQPSGLSYYWGAGGTVTAIRANLVGHTAAADDPADDSYQISFIDQDNHVVYQDIVGSDRLSSAGVDGLNILYIRPPTPVGNMKMIAVLPFSSGGPQTFDPQASHIVVNPENAQVVLRDERIFEQDTSEHSTTEEYTFYVTYEDFEGQAPTVQQLWIKDPANGVAVAYTMEEPTNIFTTYGTGKEFRYVYMPAHKDSSAGTLEYYFEFSDGTDAKRYPSAGVFTGPVLQNYGPYFAMSVDPATGILSTSYDFAITYHDVEGDAPSNTVLKLRPEGGGQESTPTFTDFGGGTQTGVYARTYRYAATGSQLQSLVGTADVEYKMDFVVNGQTITTGWQDGPFVSSNAPLADAIATPDLGLVSGGSSLSVTFDGSGSLDQGGSITSYAWTLRDAAENIVQTSSSTSFMYSFAAAGTYTAQLIVTDNDGQTGSDTAQVIVQQGTSLPVLFKAKEPTTTFYSTDAITGAAPLTVEFKASAPVDTTWTPQAYTFRLAAAETQTISSFSYEETLSGANAYTYEYPDVYTVQASLQVQQATAPHAVETQDSNVLQVMVEPAVQNPATIESIEVGPIRYQTPFGQPSGRYATVWLKDNGAWPEHRWSIRKLPQGSQPEEYIEVGPTTYQRAGKHLKYGTYEAWLWSKRTSSGWSAKSAPITFCVDWYESDPIEQQHDCEGFYTPE